MEEERLFKLNIQLFADDDKKQKLNPEDFDDDEEEEDVDEDEEDEEEEEEDETDEEESDEEEDENEDSDDDDKGKNKKKNDEVSEEEKAKRAKFAERRRKKEQREKAEREKEEAHKKEIEKAKTEAELGILKVNPFTEEPIKDKFDLEIYKIQKEIDDEGGDPINDLPARLAKRQREKDAEDAAKAKKAEEDKAKQQADIKKGIQEFQKKYPKVDVKELADDEDFQKFANNKWGRWTLTEIYEGYKKDAGDDTDNVEETTKKLTKVPKGDPSNITADKVAKMTDKEFDEYWRKKYGD